MNLSYAPGRRVHAPYAPRPRINANATLICAENAACAGAQIISLNPYEIAAFFPAHDYRIVRGITDPHMLSFPDHWRSKIFPSLSPFQDKGSDPTGFSTYLLITRPARILFSTPPIGFFIAHMPNPTAFCIFIHFAHNYLINIHLPDRVIYKKAGYL